MLIFFVKFKDGSNYQNLLRHFGQLECISKRVGIIDKYNLSLITNFNSIEDFHIFLSKEFKENQQIEKFKYFITKDNVSITSENGFNSYVLVETEEGQKDKVVKELSKLKNIELCNIGHNSNHIILVVNNESFEEIDTYTLENIWPTLGILRITPYRIIDLFNDMQ